MLITNRWNRTQEARSWVGALAAVGLLLVALAAPMSAASSKTALSGAVVSPRTGTTATTILVSVVYKNASGSRAEFVSVTIAGTNHLMARLPGGDWGHGVTFSWSGTVPVGTHAVVISAQAKDKSTATLAAGTVTISPIPTPTPKPTPTPTPTPKPTPTPTPAPTPAPTPKPTSTPTTHPIPMPTPTAQATGLPTPSPQSTPNAVLSASPGPSQTAFGTAGAPATPPPTPAPSDPSLTATIVGGPGGGGGPGQPGQGGPGQGGSDGATGPIGGSGGDGYLAWSPLASLMAIAGLHGPTIRGFGLGPTLVTTTVAVVAAMAFGLFGRRRRDDDLSDEGIAAAAARGLGVATVALAMAGSPAALGGRTNGGLESEDVEALMPRWRRPSLLLARKADPIRDNVQAPRLTFDEGLVGPLDGRERRVIRFRVVRLLDSPDELRGTEIGYLDQGDEVQLIEKYGAYWLVLSPDGQQGWLHKMTLGEIYDADGPAQEGPVATMPIAADSWTMAEADIDSDVLEAYLESRRRGG